jgi:MazG family protein
MAAKVLPTQGKDSPFETLLQVMAELRGPKGCPWDKKQTHASLTACLLEETYEVLDAIEKGDSRNLKEELGDLLLQVVFHAQIAKEEKQFDIQGVIQSLQEKLVRRHPHVFGDEKVDHADEAIHRWEKIKAAERGVDKSVLSGVPEKLPALLRAYRLGAKASRVGFDWLKLGDVLEKVEEELKELHEEIRKAELEQQKPQRPDAEGAGPNVAAVEEELGDLLFALSQAARFLKINPEDSLRKSTRKFQKRFEFIEMKLREQGSEFSDVSPSRLEELWTQAKSYTETV